tara:strand:- start:330 stop:593 length:264 start_codon:yes stop_codon:yes gene_type:complete
LGGLFAVGYRFNLQQCFKTVTIFATMFQNRNNNRSDIYMNSAYKRMLKRERRSQLVAQAIGWFMIGAGVMVCHGIWYGWLLYRASVL